MFIEPATVLLLPYSRVRLTRVRRTLESMVTAVAMNSRVQKLPRVRGVSYTGIKCTEQAVLKTVIQTRTACSDIASIESSEWRTPCRIKTVCPVQT